MCINLFSLVKNLIILISKQVDGYSATDEKIKAIVEYLLPKAFRSLSRFCDAVNFYHKTIKKCSELLRPLHEILNSDQKRLKIELFNGRISKTFILKKLRLLLVRKLFYCTQFLMQKPFCLQTQVILVSEKFVAYHRRTRDKGFGLF